MQLNELEEEIMEAISNLRIEDKVKVFKGDEKNNMLLKLKEIFVSGDPRVWWLSLKYFPWSFVFKPEQSYKEIVNFFDEEEEVWFVIEDDEQLLFKMKISHVIDIIGESTGFEYNIISENCERFLCETDHDEFLYIDINKNPPKE